MEYYSFVIALPIFYKKHHFKVFSKSNKIRLKNVCTHDIIWYILKVRLNWTSEVQNDLRILQSINERPKN